VGPATLQTQTSFLAPAADAPITPRNLSASGDQVFFQSPDALVPADTNGVTDVYEWEAPGAGSCSTQSSSFSQQDGGCLFLLSTGKSPDPSYFADASASGDDAFFFTAQSLVGQDQDQLVDVYDARVDGGLASQDPQSATSCVGDACRGPAGTSPPPPTAASVSFAGTGDAKSVATPAKVSARASVLTKTVHGTTFMVKVRVPGKGRISIAAAEIKTVHRSVSKASTSQLHVSLTKAAGRQLTRHHQLSLKLRVEYTPAGGKSATATAPLTVKPPLSRHGFHSTHRAARESGGAR